jgi:hypothetical protein
MFKDIDQDEKIDILARKVKILESKIKGGSGMSKLITSLVGLDCKIKMDYENVSCRVLDVDDEWVKLLIYGKKEDKTVIIRTDAIEKIELD